MDMDNGPTCNTGRFILARRQSERDFSFTFKLSVIRLRRFTARPVYLCHYHALLSRREGVVCRSPQERHRQQCRLTEQSLSLFVERPSLGRFVRSQLLRKGSLSRRSLAPAKSVAWAMQMAVAECRLPDGASPKAARALSTTPCGSRPHRHLDPRRKPLGRSRAGNLQGRCRPTSRRRNSFPQ